MTLKIVLIVKQENDFTSLNITFIQLKISPQKYVCKGFKLLHKYSRMVYLQIMAFFFLFSLLQNRKQTEITTVHLIVI